jgi:hypothetical protein
MAIADRILLFLRENPYGADDGEIARVLGLKRRQQANAECKALAERGLIIREYVKGQVRNLPLPAGQTVPGGAAPAPDQARWDRPWSWEGNVEAAVQKHLASTGWTIAEKATSDGDERAPDISAMGDDGTLWVSVKGYPPETARSRTNQARQSFADGLLDLIVWRSTNAEAALALALPDFIAYRRLAEHTAPVLALLAARLLWTHADGVVADTRFDQA